MKNTWMDSVVAVMVKYNIPEWIWKPIMLTESGGDPATKYITPTESSYGLFQINRMAHPEYTSEQLLDPTINAEIAARDFIAPAISSSKIDITYPNLKSAQIIYTGLVDPGDPSKGWLPSGGIRPDWSNYTTQHRFNVNAENVINSLLLDPTNPLPDYLKANKGEPIIKFSSNPITRAKQSVVYTILIFLVILIIAFATFRILKNNDVIDIDMSDVAKLAAKATVAE